MFKIWTDTHLSLSKRSLLQANTYYNVKAKYAVLLLDTGAKAECSSPSIAPLRLIQCSWG